MKTALAALQANDPSAALAALEHAAKADGCAGAAARWASRAILRGLTDAETVRAIDALRWALEHFHVEVVTR